MREAIMMVKVRQKVAFQPTTALVVTRGFHLSNSCGPQSSFLLVGTIQIGYYILLWGFVLWIGCDAWSLCTENNSFLILCFAFLVFTSSQHVV